MNLPNNQPCPKCGRFGNRGISIDAVIAKDDKILLIKRGIDPFKGYWALPGGYVEWDESTEGTVAREVSEELGLTVESCKLIGIYSSPDRHPKQVVNVAYTVKASGEPKAGADAAEFKWVALSELPKEMAFDHRKIIMDSQKNSKQA